MTGRPYLMRIAGLGLRKPKQPLPGLDLAGVVVNAGKNVTRFKLGDEVMGTSEGSSCRIRLCARGSTGCQTQKPAFEQAAAIPASGSTALQALLGQGRLRAGQKVLMSGASGGVGSFALQVAKALGGEVTGVCSQAKLDVAGADGADCVIDYRLRALSDHGERYDLILDIGGYRSLAQLRQALTRHPAH